MKTVSEHLSQVLDLVRPIEALEVALADAVGCILAEDLVSGRSLPQYDVAACDGYAVALNADGDNQVFPVVQDVDVTSQHPLQLVSGTAVRVGTGAVLPTGTDAVIAWADTDRGLATVTTSKPVRRGSNIRSAGTDIPADEVLLAAGTRLGARQLSLVAALGKPRVSVYPAPRVVIISVGDELLAPGHSTSTGNVTYDANSHALAAAIQDAHARSLRVGTVGDDHKQLRELIQDQVVRADLIITTGGLSYSEHDTLREVLEEIGDMRFDELATEPAGWQGIGTIDDRVLVLALPGHPVSAQISYELFVRPALRALSGYKNLHRRTVQAQVLDHWTSAYGRQQFYPVQVSGSPSSGYQARSTTNAGDFSLSGFVQANALAVIAPTVTSVNPGDTISCLVLD